jgi:hypothetical protein
MTAVATGEAAGGRQTALRELFSRVSKKARTPVPAAKSITVGAGKRARSGGERGLWVGVMRGTAMTAATSVLECGGRGREGGREGDKNTGKKIARERPLCGCEVLNVLWVGGAGVGCVK